MQKWRIACIIMMLCVVNSLNAQMNGYGERARQYVEQFRQLAIEEQRRSGIPAAITLAQGIHETAAGNSELATNANNHFGIKCKKEWTGQTYKYTDDAPDECFRKYSSAEQSYKDHSDYLASSPRYAALFTLKKTDYAGWATGLKRCGYATNPKYAQLLIKLVEDYNLQQYTYVALGQPENPFKESAEKIKEIRTANGGEIIPDEDAGTSTLTASLKKDEYAPQVNKSKKKGIQVSYGEEAKEVKAETDIYADNPEKPEYGQLVKVNGIRAIYVKKGTVLLNEAFKYNIRYAKLLELNDLVDGPLEADMFIYLEKKSPRGIHATRVVKEGETISQIAQSEGMQLKFLKYYNHFGSNEEPVPGAVLQLQQYTETKPQTYIKNIAPREEPVFAGSNPKAIPQGATRTRGSYISKKDIAKVNEQTDKPAEPKVKEEPVAIQNEPAVEEAVNRDEDEVIAKQVGATGTPATSNPVQKSKPEEPAKKDEVVTDEKKVPEPLKEEQSPVSETVAKAEEKKNPESEPITPPSTDEPVAKKEEQKTEDKKPEESIATEVKAEEAKEAPPLEVTVAQNSPEQTAQDAVNPSETESKPASDETSKAADAKASETASAETPEPVNPSEEVKKDEATAANTQIEPEKPKEEEPKVPEEPQDEFSRLKAQLDKVVYASDKVASSQPVASKPEEKKEEKKAEEVPVKTEETPKLYTVKKGDTAFSIAKKHNITTAQLNEWNKLDSKAVKVGQKLRVQ